MEAGHIINLCILTDCNTSTLVYIVINFRTVTDGNITTAFSTITVGNTGSVTDSNTIISSRASFTDSNRICAFSTIIIIVSATSTRVNLEEVNRVAAGTVSYSSHKLCHVNSISSLSTGCYTCNLTSLCSCCIISRYANRNST